MAACMCCANFVEQFSIFVTKWDHVITLSKSLSYIERASCHYGVYCTGFLIKCKSKSVWILCVDILVSEKILRIV